MNRYPPQIVMPNIQPHAQPHAGGRQQRNQRALVGFGNVSGVSKFVPPSYDGVAPEELPCPETPSPRSHASEDDNNQQDVELHQNAQQVQPHKQLEQQPQKQRREVKPTPSGAAADGIVGKHPDGRTFAPGTFVEYRSRTMADRWILAKVDIFDEKNKVYKLDVQPKAPMERVRLRANQNPKGEGEHYPAQGGRSGHESQQQNAIAASHPPHGMTLNHENALPEQSPLHEVQDPFMEELQQLTKEELQLRCREYASENAMLKEELARQQARVRELEQGRS
mmetsp:Transcript_24782/g.62311  ORF Transcript_24782/g.62311 Transcript_24782/m.62311 type:complete len:280 (+) Transcript_24782:624-1463(+)|eukprot:g2577.t1